MHLLSVSRRDMQAYLSTKPMLHQLGSKVFEVGVTNLCFDLEIPDLIVIGSHSGLL